MGDPECQTILPMLSSDLLDIFISCCDGTLKRTKINWYNKKSLCVVLCSKGYPGKFKKNISIKNLLTIRNKNNEYCYHAGTKIVKDKIFATGGRVLNFVCLSDTFKESRKRILKTIKELNWRKGFFRKDIGHKVIRK